MIALLIGTDASVTFGVVLLALLILGAALTRVVL